MHSKDELCYFYSVLGCIVWVSARKNTNPEGTFEKDSVPPFSYFTFSLLQ